MELTEKYSQETIDRKLMYASNRIKKAQLETICRQIYLIECDRSLDDNEEATIKLMVLRREKAQQLAAWKRFRTKNGLSNDALPI